MLYLINNRNSHDYGLHYSHCANPLQIAYDFEQGATMNSKLKDVAAGGLIIVLKSTKDRKSNVVATTWRVKEIIYGCHSKIDGEKDKPCGIVIGEMQSCFKASSIQN